MPIRDYNNMWECDIQKTCEKAKELVEIISKYEKQFKIMFGKHDYERVKELITWWKN